MGRTQKEPGDDSDYEYMQTTIEGEGDDVFTIRFDRPDKLNAANRQFIREITDVLYDAPTSTRLWSPDRERRGILRRGRHQ